MRKVEGHSHLYKNQSGAVVTTDWSVYERAKARKAREKKIDEMDDRLTRIEQLLERLIDGQEKT